MSSRCRAAQGYASKGGFFKKPACRVQVVAAAVQRPTLEGLMFPAGNPGSWDQGGVSNPVVRVYQGDDEQRWYMWYTGCGAERSQADAALPAAGSIGIAVSKDGLTWTRGAAAVEGNRQEDDVGSVLTRDTENWWTLDTAAVAVGDVQIFSSGAVQNGVGVYWMFYTGADYAPLTVPPGLLGLPPGAELEGLNTRPGLAMSQDGRNWARIEADHHTHALFDCGEHGEWDALFVAGPQVVAVGPKDMRMYYHSFDAASQKYVVGLATSPDGFRWTKRGPVFRGGDAGEFDSRGAGARCVVRDFDTRKHLMFYEAFNDAGEVSIGLAVSDDGMTNWRRHSEPVLLPGPSGAWDAGAVGAPCAVSMAEGKWRLYYCGKAAREHGAWDGIGVALSATDGGEFEGVPVRFKRRAADHDLAWRQLAESRAETA